MSYRVTRPSGPLALLLLLAACEAAVNTGPETPGGDVAQLTLLNALVDGRPFSSLRLDGATITLPTLGTGRGVAIVGGSHTLDAIDSSGRLMVRSEFAVGGGGRRTAILTDGSNGVQLLVATDTAALPVAGSSKIRVVHMAEGTSLLDAYLYRDAQTPDSSSFLTTGVGYGQGASNEFPGYVVRPPWGYRVRITARGSLNALAESPPFHALSGEIWSIVLTRSSSGALILQPVKER